MKNKIELYESIKQKNRTPELIELGFKYNPHQEHYSLFIDGGSNCDINGTWYVDDWKINDRNDREWKEYLEIISRDKKLAKKIRTNNNPILDRLNELKFKLQQEHQPKLNKTFNILKIAEIEIRIDEVQQLLSMKIPKD